MSQYKVIVGNVGTVYDGDNKQEAYKHYSEYVYLSKYDTGMAVGESVTIMDGGEVENEFTGLVDRKPATVLDPQTKVRNLMSELQSRLCHDAGYLGDFNGSKEYLALVKALQPARDKIVGLI